ncbi:alpha-L-fucosidase [Microbacterium sp. W1N]|uniref:alpha-L-fucosidase n=1 Tax=Microbacterium festucae TaxID=2977531 RepID=UPI0021C24BA7|nr:alpha-L-fucosidase [Microbacterium festucae]MCT9819333.1 alpha-L-fucosidase [Microbacterium festucae]
MLTPAGRSPDLSWVPPRAEPSDTAERLSAVDEVIRRGPFDDTWESLLTYEPPEWFTRSKFGIFVHWGVFAVPGAITEWYPRLMYRPGSAVREHHLERYGDTTVHGYKDFIPQLDFANFDPDAMAAVLRRSGARYVVPVAEHHDGFAMYDEPRTRWRAPLVGPHRDVFGELAEACRRLSLTVGASSHRLENWFYYAAGRDLASDVQDPRWSDLYGPASREESGPDQDFMDDWLLRTTHLIDAYRPQMLYFDFYIDAPGFDATLRRLAAYYYNRAAEWGRGVVLNYKNEAMPEGAGVWDIERGAAAGIRARPWQSDTSVSRSSWGYVADHAYKDVDELISDLVDVVSKNGCLLLNVGPRADGTLPDVEIALLERIGDWLAVNGEGIFGTTPWRVFGEGPTATRGGPSSTSTRPHRADSAPATIGSPTATTRSSTTCTSCRCAATRERSWCARSEPICG